MITAESRLDSSVRRVKGRRRRVPRTKRSWGQILSVGSRGVGLGSGRNFGLLVPGLAGREDIPDGRLQPLGGHGRDAADGALQEVVIGTGLNFLVDCAFNLGRGKGLSGGGGQTDMQLNAYKETERHSSTDRDRYELERYRKRRIVTESE